MTKDWVLYLEVRSESDRNITIMRWYTVDMFMTEMEGSWRRSELCCWLCGEQTAWLATQQGEMRWLAAETDLRLHIDIGPCIGEE